MKPLLFLFTASLSLVLIACGRTSPEDAFIGTWKANLEGVDSAIVEIWRDDQQIMVKLKGMTNFRDMEFPATYDEETKQLKFQFSGFMDDSPATAFLKNDTLSINSEGATLDFERISD